MGSNSNNSATNLFVIIIRETLNVYIIYYFLDNKKKMLFWRKHLVFFFLVNVDPKEIVSQLNFIYVELIYTVIFKGNPILRSLCLMFCCGKTIKLYITVQYNWQFGLMQAVVICKIANKHVRKFLLIVKTK